MSDVTPSYRLRAGRDPGGSSWRMIAIGGGLLAALGIGALAILGLAREGSGGVPLVEADPRPVRVRPADPGGLRVQNQDELIFDRDRRPANNTARLAPEAAGPRLDALRQQVAPPPAPVAAPTPAPAAAAPPAAAPAAPAAARTAPPANTGRIQVQIGALPTEEAARAEWERLVRRAPELLGDRRPTVARFEREGQTPLFRLRTGMFADADAARTFCESLRSKGGNCTVLRP